MIADVLAAGSVLWLACPLAGLVMLATRRHRKPAPWSCLVAAAPGYFFLCRAIMGEPAFWVGSLPPIMIFVLPSITVAILLTAAAALARRGRPGFWGTGLPAGLCVVMMIALVYQQLIGAIDIS